MKKLKAAMLAALLASSLMLCRGDAMAAMYGSTNLVDLLRNSAAIVHAKVETVTDGIDGHGRPYTEITVQVESAIRGNVPGTYTFRQFGLLTPRVVNGRTALSSPLGFPRFTVGEDTLLFLFTPASVTGFQTTVALGHGKFTLNAGNAENELGNEGMFGDIAMQPALVTANDERLMATSLGSVNATDLLSLVQRAVDGRWVEKGQMWKASEGQPKSSGGGGGRKPLVQVNP